MTEPKFTTRTWRGHIVDLETGPRPDQIDIEEIAHTLAQICRYNGSCNHFYSVAEHSVYVALSGPKLYRPYYLLHDSHEYIYQDICSPQKKLFFPGDDSKYRRLCAQCDKTIMETLKLNYGGFKNLTKDIKETDQHVYKLERKYLFGDHPPKPDFEKDHPLHGMPFGMAPQDAKNAFLELFTLATE